MGETMTGLVLTAGGARGAYQVGVLKRLAALRELREKPIPFDIIAGASAGAINGSMLAARAARFGAAVDEIAAVWADLRCEQVFRTDAAALAGAGLALARDFTIGGLFGHTVTNGLFDTAPLGAMLESVFPAHGIDEAIRQGHLYAVAVTATSYHSGRSFTFVEGRKGHPVWHKSRRVVVPAALTHHHVAASSAIPIVFPPVPVSVEGRRLWFGDGGLRLVTPLSPAIRLGARRLFAVGIRSSKAASSLAGEEAGSAAPSGPFGTQLFAPPLAQLCGVFMNAIFLDHLDADLEHLRRMNELLSAHRDTLAEHAGEQTAARALEGVDEPMRPIHAMMISPSEDLAMVAQRFAHRMPRLVRMVLDGLGTPDAQSADLMSYLLFDATYTRTLMEIGYRDADDRIDEIRDFLQAGVSAAVPEPGLHWAGRESA
jgi:NTE family protein